MQLRKRHFLIYRTYLLLFFIIKLCNARFFCALFPICTISRDISCRISIIKKVFVLFLSIGYLYKKTCNPVFVRETLKGFRCICSRRNLRGKILDVTVS